MPQKSRQTSSAKYIVRVPTHDPHGNLLQDLTPICWQHLQNKIPQLIHSMHAEGPHAGHQGTHRHLHILAYDTPETDSHVKQVATHVGQLVNHQTILVSKEGAQGAQAWHVPNQHYDGGSAHPEAIGFQAQPI
jgi:hypothetical protein